MVIPSVSSEKNDSSAKAAAWAAFAIYTLFVLWVLFEVSSLRPGIPAWDQFNQFNLIQLVSEGHPWLFAATSGTLYRAALHLSLDVLGKNFVGIFIPNLALIGMECLLLWRLVQKKFGPLAALGAILANLLTAYSLTRARGLYSYTALPAELLFFLWAMRYARRPSLALLWGALVGIMWVEYEGWILGYAVLALAWWSAPKSERPALKWALLGFSLTTLFVAWQSHDWFENYWLLRLSPHARYEAGASLVTLAEHLKAFFWGGENDLYLGSYAALPAWLWLPLAWGIFRILWSGPRWWLLWIACAVPMLATHSTLDEAHRASAAWPAFCLACGIGLDGIWSSWKRWPALRLVLLGTLLCFGVNTALSNRLAETETTRPYEHWDRLSLAQAILRERAQEHPLQILTDLSNRSMAAERFLLPPSSTHPTETWALVSQDFITLPPDASIGHWINLGPRNQSWDLALVLLNPSQVALFETREGFLKHLWQKLPLNSAPLEISELGMVLANPSLSDPWLRQACLERLMHQVFETRQNPAPWLPIALAEPKPGSWTLCILAQSLEQANPFLALSLADRSWAMNPTRPGLDGLRESLRAKIAAASKSLEPKRNAR